MEILSDEHSASETEENSPRLQPKKKKFVLVGAVVTLALLFCLVAGYVIWSAKNNSRIESDLLRGVAEEFSQSITLMNGLSTGKRIQEDQDMNLYLKRIEDEMHRTEVALQEMQSFEEKVRNNAKRGDVMEQSGGILQEYYRKTREDLSEYERYLAYSKRGLALSIAFSESIVTMRRGYIRGETTNESEYYKVFSESSQKFLVEARELDPPEGLRGQQEFDVRMVEKMATLLGEMEKANKEKNKKRVAEATKEFETFLKDSSMDESERMENEYFEGLHRRFSDRKEDARKGKQALVKAGLEKGIHLEIPVIDAW